MSTSSRILACSAALALSLSCVGIPSHAQEPGKPAAASAVTPELEAKFAATLTNATMRGRWCGFKDGELGPEKEDSYNIVSMVKGEGDKWTITARMNYGGQSIDLPIPVVVKWAGDTPVLVLDNVTLGPGRTYSARVMIYEKTYSGWWTAADHGGLLNGLIVSAAK